ncbi:MAG: lysophospholipid acyltransferase family protein [Anaerolineales bacterium]|nr:lysophospholipid acyltransferase family protein [Anaerolineales bacterium]
MSSKLGDAVPQRGNAVSKAIAHALFRAAGWRFEGMLPNERKFVMIGAPHTSNWDFLLAVAAIFSLGLRVSWMGKHTFVQGPFEPILRWLGGVPVDRRAPQGMVGQIVEEFERRDELVIGIAPEGTRSQTKRWKTGFYHIARAANVPIAPFSLDYGRKVIAFFEPVWPSDDMEADLARIRQLYDGVRGRHPHLFQNEA